MAPKRKASAKEEKPKAKPAAKPRDAKRKAAAEPEPRQVKRKIAAIEHEELKPVEHPSHGKVSVAIINSFVTGISLHLFYFNEAKQLFL